VQANCVFQDLFWNILFYGGVAEFNVYSILTSSTGQGTEDLRPWPVTSAP